MKYITVCIRSIFFYILITILYRIMDKREIGELSIIDFIVSIFIAEMVAISIENYKSNIFLSILPILILAFLQMLFSYITMKSDKTRNIIEGSPSIIVERGRINFEEMYHQRYNLDDLLIELRNNSIKSIEDVDYAVLETSGKLSIFKKSEDQESLYPLPVILDGKIQNNVLEKINKTTTWLNNELKRENILSENVFYAFYKGKDLYIIEKDKIK